MDVNDMSSGWAWAMMLFVTLTFLAAVGLVAWLATGGSRSTSTSPPAERPTAKQILDERLARGEIDIDEYHRRTSALE